MRTNTLIVHKWNLNGKDKVSASLRRTHRTNKFGIVSCAPCTVSGK